MAKLELKGQRFGRLVALKRLKATKSGDILWLCKCDCGNIKEVTGSNLNVGDTRSCGCLRRKSGERFGYYKNGKAPRTYITWLAMLQRCNNPNDNEYKNYGGRGISICKSWTKFENFLKDMGKRPKELTLDRINNDGNYEPGNCRWATRAEQAQNRKSTKLTPITVKIIRYLAKDPQFTQKDLAYAFDVYLLSIWKVVNYRSWVNI